MKRVLGLVAIVALATACDVDPFAISYGGGTALPDAPPEVLPPDAAEIRPPDAAGPDACMPGAEVCDGEDNDCDHEIDEIFDLQNDPLNCGECGARCTYVNAYGVCREGACQMGDCHPSWHDLDGYPGNGCEYGCILSHGGTEACDFTDNDCDGAVDEDFDIENDPRYCCDCSPCTLPNVDVEGCAEGACTVVACREGFVDVDGSPANGCEYACLPADPPVESCNGVDDDCDTLVDEGNPGGGVACGSDVGACVAGTTTCTSGAVLCVGALGPQPETCNEVDDDCDGITDEPIDKSSDPNHCGSCAPCVVPNALPACVGGACEVASCAFGWWDLDGVAANGCEHACISDSPTELCDGKDNDCDGQVDEGFDLATDEANCGACGIECSYANATGLCSGGTCSMAACHPGFYDVDGIPASGCEYFCIPAGAETCNGVDDDCDGVVDDAPAGTGLPCGSDTGTCEAGAAQCEGGAWVCVGQVLPTFETCDLQDNDCDGAVDETFDRLGDPRYCGDCTPCVVPNAVPGCSGGVCTVAACQSGWVNANGLVEDGCEYACTPSGAEVCDGADNDCDTFTDAADPDLASPANFCRQAGACAGSAPACTSTACDPTVRWRCVYGPPAETDGCGNLVVNEARCDGVDGDCDGPVDVDAYPLKGTACSDGGVGACEGTGLYVCNAAGDGLACNVTDPGVPPTAEVCNGIDDDCDGLLDDGAPDDMVLVSGVEGPFWIYRYEAVRPDADDADPGVLEHRACSKAGVQPWRNVTWTEAADACLAAGRRLCTEAEWQLACEGPYGLAYPYGDIYDGDACNGDDLDPDGTPPDDDLALATGSLAMCVSDFSAYDMSGNVKEWTSTQASMTPVAYRIRGGAYDNVADGLTCQFDFTSAEPSFAFGNLGFRCCSSTAP